MKRVQSLVLVCAAVCLLSPAEAGDVVSTLRGPGYAEKGSFITAGRTVRPFVPTTKTDVVAGFVVERANREAPRRAYVVTQEGGQLRAVLHDQQADGADAAPGQLVVLRGTAGTYAHAKELVELAELAIDDWRSALDTDVAPYSKDAARARGAWWAIVNGLEDARGSHPEHLGILHDLITGYCELLAHERGTSKGANLTRLIPAAIHAYEQRVGQLGTIEREHLTRARARLALHLGILPEALRLCDTLGDSKLEGLREVVETLSPGGFSKGEGFTVDAPSGRWPVAAYAARGEPLDSQMLFDHMYFVPRPPGAHVNHGRVWYTLSSQALDEARRWYLYGIADGGRRVLRMYGVHRPSAHDVREEVRGRVEVGLSAVHTEEEAGSSRVVLLIIGATLLAMTLLSVALRRRRNSSSVQLSGKERGKAAGDPGRRVPAASVPASSPKAALSLAEVTRNPDDPTILGLTNLSADTWTALVEDRKAVDVAPGKSVRLVAGTLISLGGTAGQAKAEIIQNPSNPSALGLRNGTSGSWSAHLADGRTIGVPPGKSVRLSPGTRIDC